MGWVLISIACVAKACGWPTGSNASRRHLLLLPVTQILLVRRGHCVHVA